MRSTHKIEGDALDGHHALLELGVIEDVVDYAKEGLAASVDSLRERTMRDQQKETFLRRRTWTIWRSSVVIVARRSKSSDQPMTEVKGVRISGNRMKMRRSEHSGEVLTVRGNSNEPRLGCVSFLFILQSGNSDF